MIGYILSPIVFLLIYIFFNFLNIPFLSISLLCIVVGLIIGQLYKNKINILEGINFTTKYILQIGIIFLGIRLSFIDLVNFGKVALPIVILVFLIIFILRYIFIIKYNSLSQKNIITLISIGTAVCGITAIMAASPFIKAKENEISYATITISIIGMISLISYPFIGFEIFEDNFKQVGLFLGSSIHDTSQVIASSMIYSSLFNNDQVIDVAIVTKLLRNSFLIILLPYLAISYSSINTNSHLQNIKNGFPLFLIGFLFFCVIRTSGDYYFLNSINETWNFLIHLTEQLSFIFINIALVSLGISTNIIDIKKIGFKTFFIGFVFSLVLFGINFLVIKNFIS